MAAQLVFDTPRNREIFNRYRMALQGNPEWEPEGKMKYKRGGGIDTVNIDGVEYYKNTSYGNPVYLHRNEKKMPFKIAGKKSAAVSSFLDSAIPIATKYATAAAALGLPIAAGNPELVPASLLVQSDVHPILAKKLRKYVKEKTGYGVYNQMEGMGDSIALRRLKTLNKLKILKNEGPSKYTKPGDYESKKLKLKAKLKNDVSLTKYKDKIKKYKKELNEEEAIDKFLKKQAKRDRAAKKQAKRQLAEEKRIIAEAKKAPAKPARKPAAKKLTKKEMNAMFKLGEEVAIPPHLLVSTKKSVAKKPAAKKPAAKKGGAMAQNPWLVEVRSYQHAHPHLSWKEAMQALSAKRKGY